MEASQLKTWVACTFGIIGFVKWRTMTLDNWRDGSLFAWLDVAELAGITCLAR